MCFAPTIKDPGGGTDKHYHHVFWNTGRNIFELFERVCVIVGHTFSRQEYPQTNPIRFQLSLDVNTVFCFRCVLLDFAPIEFLYL